jgi:hypothetical protein
MGVFFKKKEKKIHWEDLPSTSSCSVLRAKVPGGWLVRVWGLGGHGLTFYPDPEHTWDGRTLGNEEKE